MIGICVLVCLFPPSSLISLLFSIQSIQEFCHVSASSIAFVGIISYCPRHALQRYSYSFAIPLEVSTPSRMLISQIRRFLLFFDGFEGTTRGWPAQIQFFCPKRGVAPTQIASENAATNAPHAFSLGGSNPLFR